MVSHELSMGRLVIIARRTVQSGNAAGRFDCALAVQCSNLGLLSHQVPSNNASGEVDKTLLVPERATHAGPHFDPILLVQDPAFARDILQHFSDTMAIGHRLLYSTAFSILVP